MNRVLAVVEKKRKDIENRLARALVTPEQVEKARQNLDMELDEYVKFQELKTLAVAEGKLTPDEGQVIYNYLGTNPSVFNKQPVHVKAVLTSLFAELLRA
jgi:hypothetical protein